MENKKVVNKPSEEMKKNIDFLKNLEMIEMMRDLGMGKNNDPKKEDRIKR
jgi:hypothetical protein